LAAAILGSAYQRTSIWQRTLDPLPRPAVFTAIAAICKEQHKLPSLAQILRYTRDKLPPVHAPHHTTGKDGFGVPCWYFEDKPTEPTYLAGDCPEGREFIALLKKMALKKDLNEVQKPA
jgi:hypothetical protein